MKLAHDTTGACVKGGVPDYAVSRSGEAVCLRLFNVRWRSRLVSRLAPGRQAAGADADGSARADCSGPGGLLRPCWFRGGRLRCELQAPSADGSQARQGPHAGVAGLLHAEGHGKAPWLLVSVHGHQFATGRTIGRPPPSCPLQMGAMAISGVFFQEMPYERAFSAQARARSCRR